MTPLIAIQDLVRAGAAITIRADPTPIAVVWWKEVGPKVHFWFEPGTTKDDGHRLDYSHVEVLYGGAAVSFRDAQLKLIAYLAPIEEQADEPELAARLMQSIAVWRQRFAESEDLRSFVFSEAAAAAG